MNKKRILSLLLAIVMVISLVPTYVFATEGEPTDPTVTEPVVTEPVVTEPVVTEPVVTESVVTEPAAPVGVECEVCGALDCQSTHENWCEICKVDDCGQTHEPTAPSTEATEATQPSTEPTQPSTEATEPSTEPTQPSTETTEPTQPTEPAEPEGPQVGDKIWIKSGSKTYVNPDKGDVWGNSRDVLFNYETTIVSIITDENGNAQWYEFKPTGLLQIFASYKYVKVENTTTVKPDEQPEDEHACNCGENAPENLANHADSCPRKQYIKTLFEGKTAEEIHAQWETYDEATRKDILAMLEVYDQAKFEELKVLLEGISDEVLTELGHTVTASGIPEGVTLNVANVDKEKISDIYENVLCQYGNTATFSADASCETQGRFVDELFAYDISIVNPDGTEWQPSDAAVAVTLRIPDLDVGSYQKVCIAHKHGETIKYIDAEVDAGSDTVTFTTDGFSVFYGFIVDFEYNGYSFGISGESEIKLSELMREIGISRSVSSVVDVAFSDESLIEIKKENGDWILKSIKSFNTEEWLTIYFADGSEIQIKVTDPVVKYYLTGTDWNMGTSSVSVKKSGASSAMGTYTANTTSITEAEVIEASNTSTDVDMIVYARPGMAIGFTSGTTWEFGSWVLADSETGKYKKDHWEWVWDGTTNYAVLSSDINTVTNTKIELKETVGEVAQICTVQIVIVPERSSPTLLSTALKSTSAETQARYELREVPATLYNYDGAAFNKMYNGSTTPYFAFASKSMGVDPRAGLTNAIQWTTSDKAVNGGGSSAMMGIVKPDLVNGLPVMSQGQQVDLFSKTSTAGKKVFNDVTFEFIYDNDSGYYTYNSELNHAQFNGSNKIQLYKESLSPLDSGISTGNNSKAGLYPFVDIYDAFMHSSAPNLSVEQKLAKLEAGVDNSNRLFGDVARDLVSTTTEGSHVDMHFALQIAAPFYLPTGKTLNGHEMIYEFTGDDDLWVFIDGKLVLDIGGGHTPVSGTFNVTTGKVTIDKYTKLSTANGGYYASEVVGTNLEFTSDVLTGLAEDQMHTIQIFYMERHSGESNCRMRFNLPLVPSNSVIVGKELLNSDGGNVFAVTPDVDYSFTVYTAIEPVLENRNDNPFPDTDLHKFTPYANKKYTLLGGGSGQTDENGTFTLRDGELATFEGIERFTNVYVVESDPKDNVNDKYSYTLKSPTLSVNDGAANTYVYGTKSQTKVMQLNESIKYSFVNYMDIGDLTVTKDLIDEYGAVIGTDEEAFEVELKLDGTAFTGAVELNGEAASSEAGKFILKDDDAVTIRNIPVNTTYSVKETDPEAPSGYEYKAPIYKDAEGNGFGTGVAQYTTAPNTALTGDTTITITNELKALFGHLTITKTGIQDVDDHEAEGTNKQEQQSTMYRIQGTSDAGDSIDMEVVIVDNDSITINYIPVGTYHVYELTDWSWRYEPENNVDVKQVKIEGGKTSTVEYKNERKLIYWLSGDNYAKNWFNPDFYK